MHSEIGSIRQELYTQYQGIVQPLENLLKIRTRFCVKDGIASLDVCIDKLNSLEAIKQVDNISLDQKTILLIEKSQLWLIDQVNEVKNVLKNSECNSIQFFEQIENIKNQCYTAYALIDLTIDQMKILDKSKNKIVEKSFENDDVIENLEDLYPATLIALAEAAKKSVMDNPDLKKSRKYFQVLWQIAFIDTLCYMSLTERIPAVLLEIFRSNDAEMTNKLVYKSLKIAQTCQLLFQEQFAVLYRTCVDHALDRPRTRLFDIYNLFQEIDDLLQQACKANVSRRDELNRWVIKPFNRNFTIINLKIKNIYSEFCHLPFHSCVEDLKKVVGKLLDVLQNNAAPLNADKLSIELSYPYFLEARTRFWLVDKRIENIHDIQRFLHENNAQIPVLIWQAHQQFISEQCQLQGTLRTMVKACKWSSIADLFIESIKYPSSKYLEICLSVFFQRQIIVHTLLDPYEVAVVKSTLNTVHHSNFADYVLIPVIQKIRVSSVDKKDNHATFLYMTLIAAYSHIADFKQWYKLLYFWFKFNCSSFEEDDPKGLLPMLDICLGNLTVEEYETLENDLPNNVSFKNLVPLIERQAYWQSVYHANYALFAVLHRRISTDPKTVEERELCHRSALEILLKYTDHKSNSVIQIFHKLNEDYCCEEFINTSEGRKWKEACQVLVSSLCISPTINRVSTDSEQSWDAAQHTFVEEKRRRGTVFVDNLPRTP